MNIEFFITKKIIRDKTRSSFSRNAVGIAVLSVALGLSVMIIAVAIVTGFQNEIASKVIGFGAHIQVSKFDNNMSLEMQPVDSEDYTYTEIAEHPAVSHVQVFGVKPGIIKTNDNIQGIVVKGIADDFNWSFFDDRLVEGSRLIFSDTTISDNIIISKYVANLLNLKLGDKVQLWFIQNPPRVRVLEITGLYETGLEEFDMMYVLADIRHIQKLNNWNNNEVSGIEIFLNDFSELDEMSQYVNDEISYDVHARSIKEIYPGIFDWLGLLDMNAVVILVIMLLVASINMITTLLIIILERTRMIGILKAIGANNASIAGIFLYYAFYILIRGLFWGNLISIGLCLLQIHTGIISLPQESYFVSVVPVNLNLWHVLWLNAGTMFCCLLILILPAFIVSRISPVSAIRYD